MLPSPIIADHLAAQLAAQKLLLFPLAGFRGSTRLRNEPRHRKHQRDGVLRHRNGVAARRIHHQHAGRGRRRQIDVIDAHARRGRSRAASAPASAPLSVTCTALRTISASASARCFAYSFGLETMTFQPCCAWNSSMPACAIGSAIRTFIYAATFCAPLVDSLDRRHAFAQFHILPVGPQDQFQSRDDAEHVGEIEVTEMRHAENLALHAALAVGDNRAEALFESLDDDFRIHARRALSPPSPNSPAVSRTAPAPAPGTPRASPLASSCAFSIRFAIPTFLMYFSASPSARISDVAGVQLDSLASPLFFSFFRLK